jgi:hypothetical protein
MVSLRPPCPLYYNPPHDYMEIPIDYMHITRLCGISYVLHEKYIQRYEDYLDTLPKQYD